MEFGNDIDLADGNGDAQGFLDKDRDMLGMLDELESDALVGAAPFLAYRARTKLEPTISLLTKGQTKRHPPSPLSTPHHAGGQSLTRHFEDPFKHG